MKLSECKSWKALHFKTRTILQADKALYPELAWKALLNTAVTPMKEKGHYKAEEKNND